MLLALAALFACESAPPPPRGESTSQSVATNLPPGPEDDADIVEASFPDALSCGATAAATVAVRNTGTASWTREAGYKLGAVDDEDPFNPSDPRAWLDDGAEVAPGSTWTFDIPLVAPDVAGVYVTDWQMVHEGVRWFGPATSATVTVTCDEPPVPAPFDLATAVVLNSPPDAPAWAETAAITTLDLGPDGVFVDFSKRDGDGSWPDVPFGAPGDSLEYTLWIALDIGGTWYTSGCIQYWRGLERNGGPPSGYAENWYYDANRWGPMTGYQPAVGEQVGFFVTAGNARNVVDDSGSIVYERSNVVVVPFPSDSGAVFAF